MIRKEIRIAGFGGQGVILSGNIIGKAASIFSGGHAAFIQSYGPESRGGSCAAEVVISDEPVDYPYVTNPEVQIILSQEAYTKYGRNPPPGTLVIIDADLVKVDPDRTPWPLACAATRLATDELKRPVVANILMLGFLAAVSDIVSTESLKKAVLDSIPAGTEAVNIKAFELGYSYGIKGKQNG